MYDVSQEVLQVYLELFKMKKYHFYIAGLVIASIIVILTQYCKGYQDDDIWGGILVEANGIILEFIIIVVLYEAYNKNKVQQVKAPLINMMNARFYQESTNFIEFLLSINKDKKDKNSLIHLQFGKNNSFSLPINYYKNALKEYNFGIISENDKKTLEDVVHKYIEEIEDIISYNIYDLDLHMELRKIIEECHDIVRHKDSPRSKRPAIKLLLEVLDKLSIEAKICNEVW